MTVFTNQEVFMLIVWKPHESYMVECQLPRPKLLCSEISTNSLN